MSLRQNGPFALTIKLPWLPSTIQLGTLNAMMQTGIACLLVIVLVSTSLEYKAASRNGPLAFPVFYSSLDASQFSSAHSETDGGMIGYFADTSI